jgi:transposase-like protein
MKKQEQEAFEKKALDQLLSGKSLFGKEGAFAPMLKGFIAEALASEKAAHLRETPEKNKRNGKGRKTLNTNIGEVEISTPTDRNSSFEPSIVKNVKQF